MEVLGQIFFFFLDIISYCLKLESCVIQYMAVNYVVLISAFEFDSSIRTTAVLVDFAATLYL